MSHKRKNIILELVKEKQLFFGTPCGNTFLLWQQFFVLLSK